MNEILFIIVVIIGAVVLILLIITMFRLTHRTNRPLIGRIISRYGINYSLKIGKRSGVISEIEHTIISRVLQFSETTAKEVMVPRPDIIALDVNAPMEEIIRVVTEEGYSRIPIYDKSIDNIYGILFVKDLIGLTAYSDTFEIQDIVKPVHFVPENKKISRLLTVFQKKKIHLAIVVDEFGGTEGIITLEDIIEEILGEIHDEYDEVKKSFVKGIDGTWLIDGNMNIAEFNETFEVNIPEDVDYETLNGFLQKLTGRIPDLKEEIQYGNLSFHIVRKNERRIERIKIKRH